MTATETHYKAPGSFTRNIFNGLVAAATRRGLSVWGSRVLEVRGRRSGRPRTGAVVQVMCEPAAALSDEALGLDVTGKAR